MKSTQTVFDRRQSWIWSLQEEKGPEYLYSRRGFQQKYLRVKGSSVTGISSALPLPSLTFWNEISRYTLSGKESKWKKIHNMTYKQGTSNTRKVFNNDLPFPMAAHAARWVLRITFLGPWVQWKGSGCVHKRLTVGQRAVGLPKSQWSQMGLQVAAVCGQQTGENNTV